MKKILITFFLLISIRSSYAQSFILRKTEWTVPEVKEWVEKCKNSPAWYGRLMYQGSDSICHHYISRVMDEFVWFKIKRSELTIEDEKPFRNYSGAPLGYYFVDALNEFRQDFSK